MRIVIIVTLLIRTVVSDYKAIT